MSNMMREDSVIAPATTVGSRSTRSGLSRRRFLKSSGLVGLALGVGKHSAVLASTVPALTFQLDWKFNAQFAGPLLADHLGYFSDRGVDLSIEPWSSGMLVTDEVAENPTVIGCAEQNLLLSAQSRGAPIRAVATMFQASPLSLMSLPSSGVRSLTDLKNEKVGVHIDGLDALRLVMQVSGLGEDSIEVDNIPYEDKFERLISGEMKAIQCYAVDEPINFAEATGINPDILPLNDYGYEAYAQVIFAHEKLLSDHPQAVKAMLAAQFQGWQSVLKDRSAAAQVIVSHYAEPGSKYQNLAYQSLSLTRVLDYLTKDVDARSVGSINALRWMRMARLFQEFGVIDTLPALEDSLATGFWPA